MIELIEFIKRSDKGITNPFIFKANNGKLYYVKGKHAGYRSLICEWLGGKLAVSLGLNVPAFGLGYVNTQLFRILPADIQQALGRSELFVSEAVPFAKDLRWEQVALIPEQERQSVALFDLWVRNEDRTLRPDTMAGNPNLLMAAGKLYVIDHNLIFDQAFDLNKFRDTHVFSEMLAILQQDQIQHEIWTQQLYLALQCWNQVWQQTPDLWKETGSFDATHIKRQLEDDVGGALWTRIRS